MISTKERDGRIVVLQSFRHPRATSNPYVSLLLSSLEPLVEVRAFGWGRALFGRYDVLHLHWPDLLLVGRTPIRTAAANVLFRLVLWRIRASRIALVRTVHNIAPHEARSGLVSRALQLADASTTTWISMADGSELPAGARGKLIPHGHYREWFSAHHREDRIAGRMLFFGLVRSYKGVDRLLEAFARLRDPSVTLRVVGKPDPALLGARLEDAARVDERMSMRLTYVDDAELAVEISRAQLVVLPYREMLNSGAVLLALSLGRPVLVPSNAGNDSLASEVGQDWVHRYEGALSSEALELALSRTSSMDGAPDLSRREWASIASSHEEVYRRATGRDGSVRSDGDSESGSVGRAYSV